MSNELPKQPSAKDFNQTTHSSGPTPKLEKIKLEDYEQQYSLDVLSLIRNGKEQRETEHDEFDGMGYTERVGRDWRNWLAYVPPAKDKNDIRLNPGIGRDKIITAIRLAMSYNFEAECRAFNQNDEFLRDLSNTATDLIFKSDILEEWRFNRQDVYDGQAALGTYFTMEMQFFPISHRKTHIPLANFGSLKVDWNDMPRKNSVQFRTVALDPRMVIVGNIKETDLRKQPWIAVTRVLSEADARTQFGTFDRWNAVPLREGREWFGNQEDAFAEYVEKYAVSDVLTEGQVEITYFMRSVEFGNELQIFLNGVPMLPVMNRGKVGTQFKISGFPLTSWSRSGEYPIVDWHLERNLHFFYSKGYSSKTLFDETIVQFFFRWMVEKAMRSINPGLVNNSGVELTRDILGAGVVLTDVPADSIKTLLPAELIQGISNGDVSMLNLVKDLISQKTVSNELQGQGLNPYQTAQQFNENQKAQLLKLGSLIDNIIRAEMRRADLRLRNSILPYWYSKYDYDGVKKKSASEAFGDAVADIYDSFTIERSDKGGKFDSVIKIGDTTNISPLDLMDEEERTQKRTGQKKRLIVTDPDKMDFMRTLFYWKVKPSERENDVMQKAQVDGDIAMVKNLFPGKADDEKLSQLWARSRDSSYDDYFSDTGITPDMLGGGMALGADSTQGLRQPGASGVVPPGGMNSASVTPPSSRALS